MLPAAQGKEPHHGRDHRARAAPDRSSQLERQDAGRLHPWALAAAEQLGQLGRSVRGERLRGCDALLAGRPGNGRGGSRQPRGLREEDPEAGCRPHRQGDRPARQEARRDGPFDGRPAHLHDRRPGALSRLGGDRPGAVPRRPAPAALGIEVGQPGAAESAQPRPRDHPHASTSSSTDGPTRSTTRRRGSCTTRTTWPGPGWP